MKTFLLIIAVLALAVSAFATDLARVPATIFSPPNSSAIQTFAPDGRTTTALTVAQTTANMSNYIMFEVETGSTTSCMIRLMPLATSPRANYVQRTFRIAGTIILRAVNVATPFVNMSGCTGGSYSMQ